MKHKRPVSLRVLLLVALTATSPVAFCADVEVPDDSPRRTATVQVIQRSLPSVVTIVTEMQQPVDGQKGRIGSGSVIHERGYVLTNEHVVRHLARGAVFTSEGKQLPMRVIGSFPHEDLAILQISPQSDLPAIELGRSDDLLLGEPVVVIGSPGGLAHTVSTGIVSGLNRSTISDVGFLPWMVQTSAATSGGNSGGPLLNALGQQIGVVSTKNHELDSVSFAIVVDHVRAVLPQIIAAQERQQIWFGIEVDMLEASSRVLAVTTDSPAAKAGIRVDDVITRVNDMAIRSGVHFHLSLLGLRAGQKIVVGVQRDEKPMTVDVQIGELPLEDPLAEENLKPGLDYRVYRSAWDELPDFSELESTASGIAARPDLVAFGVGQDDFGLVFEGMIRVPKTGLYGFYTRSDDGSRLTIGSRIVVQNDRTHPVRESGGLVVLKAGLHAIRVEYFERSGNEALDVGWEGPGFTKESIPATVFFVRDCEAESGDIDSDDLETKETLP